MTEIVGQGMARGRSVHSARHPERSAPALSLLCLVALTATSSQPRLVVLIVILISGGISLANLLWVTRIQRVEFALAGLLAIFIGVPFTRLGQSPLLIATILAGALALVSSTARREWLTRPPRQAGLLLILLAWYVGVTALSPDPGVWIRSALLVVPVTAGFFLLGYGSAQDVRSLARTLLTLAMFQVLLSVVQLVAGLPALWAPAQRSELGIPLPLMNPFFGGVVRAQGTLGHPLPLGYLLMVSVAVFLSVLRPRLPAQGVVVVAHVTGLVLAGSRFSLVATLILCVVLWNDRDPGRRAVIGSALVIAALVYAQSRFASVDPVVRDVSTSGSYTHRVGAVSAAARLIFQQDGLSVLTGNGLGANPRLFNSGLLQADGFETVDNQYVQTLAHSGLVGLILLLAIFGSVILGAPTKLRPLLVASALNLAIFDALMWPSLALLTAVLWGCASSRLVVDAAAPPPDQPPIR